MTSLRRSMRGSFTATLVALAAIAPAGGQGHDHGSRRGEHDAQLASQIEAVRRATERYRDHAVALADGYVKFGREAPLMGEHWYHPERVRAPLDLERPSTLQYATLEGERTLVGVAYGVYRAPADSMPVGFAGDADVWHVHDVTRIGEVFTEGRPLLKRWLESRRRRGAAPGGDGRTQLTMVHAWIWLENPDGMFADAHRALPYLRAGLPAAWAEHGDAAAAQGASLLLDSGCDFEQRRLRGVARADRAQRRQLADACARAERAVRAAGRGGANAAAFNAAAGAAWRGYARVVASTLRPEQQARLAALVEHPRHP